MFTRTLTFDFETYSSAPIDEGTSKYTSSPDFEIQMVSFILRSFGNNNIPTLNEVRQVDFFDMQAYADDLRDFMQALNDPHCQKRAFNCKFERLSLLHAWHINIPLDQWHDTMVKCAYCGLPLKLSSVSEVLNLQFGKKATGTALINFFAKPCKPTKTNGYITKNNPMDSKENWELYKEYNRYDTLAETEIDAILSNIEIPEIEQKYFITDQIINDRGILIDKQLAENAVKLSNEYTAKIQDSCEELTGIKNLKSVPQICDLVESEVHLAQINQGSEPDYILPGTDKENIEKALEDPLVLQTPKARYVLECRQKINKASVAKYTKMLKCMDADNRVRGSFQFYGANRTGRFAGRNLQLQNLSKNHIEPLDSFRELVKTGNLNELTTCYNDPLELLSQMVRPTLIAPKGKTFCVADFSAIEARVISWLADEQWRLDVFKGDGKIYEATGEKIFGIPKEQIKKGSIYRDKSKVCELALGYGGSIGAFERMGGAKFGLTEADEKDIIGKWRSANPCIVQMWHVLEASAIEAVRNNTTVVTNYKGVTFQCDGAFMTITLPSDRKLFYYHPKLEVEAKFGSPQYRLTYEGSNQVTKKWCAQDTYGGKLTENIVQAIARDLLCNALQNLQDYNRKDVNGFHYDIVAHIHDEAICEVPGNSNDSVLELMIKLMTSAPSWADGLPLNADGYITPYYKKD